MEKHKEAKGSEHLAPAALDGGYGWIVLAACFTINLIVFGWANSQGLLLEELLATTPAPSSLALVVPSLYSCLIFAVAPVANLLSRRITIRGVLILGNFLHAAGLLVSAAAPSNVYFLIISLGVISGVGIGMILSMTFIIASQYFDKWRGLACGIVSSGCGAGTFAIPSLLRYLMDHFTLMGCFLIYGAVLLNGIWLSGLCRPVDITLKLRQLELSRVEKEKGASKDANNMRGFDSVLKINSAKYITATNGNSILDSSQGGPNGLETTSSPLIVTESVALGKSNNFLGSAFSMPDLIVSQFTLQEKRRNCSTEFRSMCGVTLFKDYRFTIFLVPVGAVVIGFYGILVIIPNLLVEKGSTQQQSALAITIFGIGNLIGRISFSFISDLGLCERRSAFAMLLACYSVVTIGLLYCSNFLSAGILCAILGLLVGAFYGIEPVCIADVVGIEKLGAALGLVYLTKGICSLFGVYLVGVIRDAHGSWQGPVWFVMAIQLVGALVLSIGLGIEGALCRFKCRRDTEDPA